MKKVNFFTGSTFRHRSPSLQCFRFVFDERRSEKVLCRAVSSAMRFGARPFVPSTTLGTTRFFWVLALVAKVFVLTYWLKLEDPAVLAAPSIECRARRQGR